MEKLAHQIYYIFKKAWTELKRKFKPVYNFLVRMFDVVKQKFIEFGKKAKLFLKAKGLIEAQDPEQEKKSLIISIFKIIGDSLVKIVNLIKRFPIDIMIALFYFMIFGVVMLSILGLISGIKMIVKDIDTKNKLVKIIKDKDTLTYITLIVLQPILKEIIRYQFLKAKDIEHSYLLTFLYMLQTSTVAALKQKAAGSRQISASSAIAIVSELVAHKLQTSDLGSAGLIISILIKMLLNGVTYGFARSELFVKMKEAVITKKQGA